VNPLNYELAQSGAARCTFWSLGLCCWSVLYNPFNLFDVHPSFPSASLTPGSSCVPHSYLGTEDQKFV